MRRVTLAVLLAAVLCVAAATVIACASNPADDAEQQKQECFANEQRIKMAIDLIHADSGIYPDVGLVVSKLQTKCPVGGTYSFEEKTDVVSCSAHGHP